MRSSLWFTPVTLLLIVQVLGKALFDIDAFASLATVLDVLLPSSAGVACVMLDHRSVQPTLTGIASLLRFGTPALSKALRSRLGML